MTTETEKEVVKFYETQMGVPFRDNLTGLYNHSLFQITLDHEIKRYRRYGKPFAIALVDIDSFSFFNEVTNHAHGDLMLREIGKLINSNIREVDIAARYSGDQFIILLTGTGIEEGVKIVERIRSAVEDLTCGKLTISIGIVLCPSDGINRIALIKKVNEALQEAKIRGKNLIYYFERIERPVIESESKVLIVDDSPANQKILEAMLISQHLDIIKLQCGEDALDVLAKHSDDIDLIILDVMMPGMSGFEVCRQLKGNDSTRMIPIIIITSLHDKDSKIKGIEAGADDFIINPPDKVELVARIKHLIQFRKLTKRLANVKNVLLSLANTVEAKDIYTQGHVERVANLTVAVGMRMCLPQKSMEALWFAGVLHDIGKIGIPNEILNKPGPLDSNEWEIMKTHAKMGYKDLLLPLRDILGLALEAIRHHHEKLDGSGYPDGLTEDSIPITARILTVVDCYDAMTTDRPYRKGMTKEKAFEILRLEAKQGKLDKSVVENLFDLIKESSSLM